MGKLFGILLTAITVTSAAICAAHIWWMPANISAQGAAVDRLMRDTLAGTGFLSSHRNYCSLYLHGSSANIERARFRTFLAAHAL